MTDLNSLPQVIIVEIFIRLDGVALSRCRVVCKKWKELIDDSEYLWKRMCLNDYIHPAKVAKKKCGPECTWFHIYRNFYKWCRVGNLNLKMRKFYRFTYPADDHALPINYSILPLKDNRGTIFFDMNTLKFIPVILPEKECLKVAANQFAVVVLLQSGILVQRAPKNPSFMAEAFFEADNFVLHGEKIYFYKKREIRMCDLQFAHLASELIHHFEYNIRVMNYENNILHVFTPCGRIMGILKGKSYLIRIPNPRPPIWITHMKQLSVADDKNYVFYSEDIIKFTTIKFQTLNRCFPLITAVFFYVDFMLVGTKSGRILLYRPSRQISKDYPSFEKIAELPNGQYAVQLDVCERKCGPVIVAVTKFNIFIVEIDFFPKVSIVIMYNNY